MPVAYMYNRMSLLSFELRKEHQTRIHFSIILKHERHVGTDRRVQNPLAGTTRIKTGEQYTTVYKPHPSRPFLTAPPLNTRPRNQPSPPGRRLRDHQTDAHTIPNHHREQRNKHRPLHHARRSLRQPDRQTSPWRPGTRPSLRHQHQTPRRPSQTQSHLSRRNPQLRHPTRTLQGSHARDGRLLAQHGGDDRDWPGNAGTDSARRWGRVVAFLDYEGEVEAGVSD